MSLSPVTPGRSSSSSSSYPPTSSVRYSAYDIHTRAKGLTLSSSPFMTVVAEDGSAASDPALPICRCLFVKLPHPSLPPSLPPLCNFVLKLNS